MEKENVLLVNLRVLVTYFPEIVECLSALNLRTRCKGCEFKDECRVISTVGFLMERAMIGMLTKEQDTVN